MNDDIIMYYAMNLPEVLILLFVLFLWILSIVFCIKRYEKISTIERSSYNTYNKLVATPNNEMALTSNHNLYSRSMSLEQNNNNNNNNNSIKTGNSINNIDYIDNNIDNDEENNVIRNKIRKKSSTFNELMYIGTGSYHNNHIQLSFDIADQQINNNNNNNNNNNEIIAQSYPNKHYIKKSSMHLVDMDTSNSSNIQKSCSVPAVFDFNQINALRNLQNNNNVATNANIELSDNRNIIAANTNILLLNANSVNSTNNISHNDMEPLLSRLSIGDCSKMMTTAATINKPVFSNNNNNNNRINIRSHNSNSNILTFDQSKQRLSVYDYDTSFYGYNNASGNNSRKMSKMSLIKNAKRYDSNIDNTIYTAANYLNANNSNNAMYRKKYSQQITRPINIGLQYPRGSTSGVTGGYNHHNQHHLHHLPHHHHHHAGSDNKPTNEIMSGLLDPNKIPKVIQKSLMDLHKKSMWNISHNKTPASTTSSISGGGGQRGSTGNSRLNKPRNSEHFV